MIINEYNICKTLFDNGFKYQIIGKCKGCYNTCYSIEFTYNGIYRIDFENEEIIQIVKYNSTLQPFKKGKNIIGSLRICTILFIGYCTQKKITK